VTCSQMRIEAGHAVPSAEPGLGIDWDWEALSRHQAEGSARVIT
jgi:L-alanine-DL-glutamate epimerase-like enolase superfamily enzyme